MKKLYLYFNTLRYLRWEQFVFRLLLYLPNRPITIRKTPPVRNLELKIIDGVLKPDSFTPSDNFRFLNQDGCLSKVGWQGNEMSALWVYNLHYFDWLNSQSSRLNPTKSESTIMQWIEQNEVGRGPGWEPYPTSLRIVNWIKFHWLSRSLSVRMIESLAIQSQSLYNSIEWHLLGNHLFANGKALVFAGTFFSGPIANKWLQKGIKIISQQLDEQILSDGGHFELSPMYHCIILEDCLDLINLLEQACLTEADDLVKKLRSSIPLMFRWISLMSFSDNKISFFNDSTFGVSAEPSLLFDFATRMGLEGIKFNPGEDYGINYLDYSGYIRMNNGPFELIFDVGEVGPTYQPGHAHADTLSFELATNGHRLIVNSGTSVYDTSAQRSYERSTAAHSTVEIEGENSSEVWSGFRVARRALPFGLTVNHDTESVACGHDGYKRLKQSPLHVREIRYNEGCIQIKDKVSINTLNAVAHFYLHPDWDIEKTDEGVLCIFNNSRVFLTCEEGEGVLLKSYYNIGFNKSKEGHCLCVQLFNGNATLSIRCI